METNLLNLSVTLVAVSKFRSQKEIDCLKSKGVTIFAENRVQELKKKALANPDVTWHLIGHLQTNKVRDAVQYASLIHSVDSIHLLAAIDHEAAKQNKQMEVLIQVNVAEEESKFGIRAEKLVSFLKEAAVFPHIQIRGLMVIAPLIEDEQLLSQIFKQGKVLYDSLFLVKQDNLSPCWLSMGMSHDYQIAIACGSNMVRIGTLLFETYAQCD